MQCGGKLILEGKKDFRCVHDNLLESSRGVAEHQTHYDNEPVTYQVKRFCRRNSGTTVCCDVRARMSGNRGAQ
jgi:hypothetical protein